MSLASLNSSGIQQSNPALYQTIKDLSDQVLQLQNLVDSFKFTVNSDLKQLSLKNSLNLLAGQIGFPNIQNPSIDINTLDDYEEGSWIPVFGGSGGTSGQAYSTQIGQYIKIGKLVFASGFAALTAKGVITTFLQLQGLPFNSDANVLSIIGLITGWANMATVWSSLGLEMQGASTAAFISGVAAPAVSRTFLTTADVANNSSMSFSIVYKSDQ